MPTPTTASQPTEKPALSDGLIGLVTRRMELLSDPTRVRLVLTLESGEAHVQQLAEALDLAHKNVSQGLNVLYREGVVARHRRGALMVYALADYSMCHLIRKAAESATARVEELGELIAG